MHGIIMAGGEGTRLRPLTLTKPKPMVTLLGRPVIDFVAHCLAKAGVDELVVTTGYRGEQLESHVQDWNSVFSIPSRVNQESSPMGTAGSVRLLKNELHETCIVGSGDSVASYDLTPLLDAHRLNQAKVTMALWEVNDPSQYGIVGLSARHQGTLTEGLDEGFIARFAEKPKREDAFSNLINAGLYIIEPEVFDHIPENTKFDFSKELFPLLLDMGWPLYAKKIEGMWFDVGHPQELLNAQRALLQHQHFLPFSLQLEDNNEANSSQHTTALFHQSDSFVGEDCVIGDETSLKNSYVMKGSTLGSQCVLQSSIVGESCTIGDGTQLINCILGDGVSISPGSHLENERIPQ
jgi:mannose-1-phosphate guanylyltransferase